MMPGWWRNPPLRSKGRAFVTAVCGYELVALWTPGLPTLSELVQRHRDVTRGAVVRASYAAVGVAMIGLLLHHWYVELSD